MCVNIWTIKFTSLHFSSVSIPPPSPHSPPPSTSLFPASVRVCTCVYICVCMYVCVRACMCAYVCVCARARVCVAVVSCIFCFCKQLFQNFNTILGKSRSSPLPSTFDSDDLPNVFSDYFTEKIRTIRNNFPPPNPTACPDTSFAGNPLLTFESVTDEFVLKNNQQCICQVL